MKNAPNNKNINLTTQGAHINRRIGTIVANVYGIHSGKILICSDKGFIFVTALFKKTSNEKY